VHRRLRFFCLLDRFLVLSSSVSLVIINDFFALYLLCERRLPTTGTGLFSDRDIISLLSADCWFFAFLGAYLSPWTKVIVSVPHTVSEIEIEDHCTFLKSFTLDVSVGQRISQDRRWKMTFADFTKDLIELYILEDIKRQIQDMRILLLNVTKEHQRVFEIEIVEKANRWMEYQPKKFRQLAMSDQMIQKGVEALEQAAA